MKAFFPLARRRGFTLVEIAMAMALIAVALSAILAVLGMATDLSRDTNRDTVLVSMTSQVLDDLRPLPFESLGAADPRKFTDDYRKAPTSLGMTDTTSVDNDSKLADSVYYFTNEGKALDSTVSTSQALYRCTVKKYRDLGSVGYDTKPIVVNLLRVELIFEWPLAAPKPQKKKIYASFARY